MTHKKRIFAWLMTVLLMLSVVGCGVSVKPRMLEVVTQDVALAKDGEADLPVDLSHETVQDLHADDEVVVVDVRQPVEYAAGRIPGARLIPLDELPNRLDEVPEDQRVVVVCRSGNRSSSAQRLLADEGFDNVHNMLGGMIAWEGAGYDVER
jgi:rhodanese-related sulfurtransferase